MAYTPYYSGGWQSGQEGNTPITPAALNNIESGLGNAASIADKNAAILTGVQYVKSGVIERDTTVTISSVKTAVLFVIRNSDSIFGISDGNRVNAITTAPGSLNVTVSNNTLSISNSGNTCIYMLVGIKET